MSKSKYLIAAMNKHPLLFHSPQVAERVVDAVLALVVPGIVGNLTDHHMRLFWQRYRGGNVTLPETQLRAFQAAMRAVLEDAMAGEKGSAA